MLRYFVLLGCVLESAAASVQAQQPVVAFVDVSVIPMDTDRVLSGQTVLVRDTRIAAIGPAGAVSVPPDAVKVNGQGKYLMPGLADMHAHLIYKIKAGRRDAETIQHHLFQILANGFTTLRDMHGGGPMDSLAMGMKRDLAAGRLIGPHLYTAGDPAVGDTASARKSVAELKALGHEFIKISGGWPKEVYDVVQTTADSLGLRISGHVESKPTGGVESVLKARWASIEHLMGYVNYLVGATDFEGEVAGTDDERADWLRDNYKLDEAKLNQIVAATRQAGVWNCPTLAAVQSVMETAPIERAGQRFFEYNLRIVKALHDAGAGLLLGLDNYSVDTNLQEELELLTRAGLTPYQALEIGTRSAARFMNIEAQVGTVAIGKQADLVLLDKNPLTDVHNTKILAGVMIEGRWLPRAELEQRLSRDSDTRPEQDPDGKPGP